MKLEEALKLYREHFGRNYPLLPGGWNETEEEIVSNIKRCIETNTTAKPPVYDEDKDY